jgi:peptidylprolyl isomerase
MKIALGLAAAILVTTTAGAAEKASKPAVQSAPPPAPGPSDWRAIDAANALVIQTNKGVIYVELTPVAAPAAAERLKKLARAHFYDGLNFFRVIDDFMAQTGDPKNDSSGRSEEPNLPAEFVFRMGPDAAFSMVDNPTGMEEGFIGALPVVRQPAAMSALTIDAKVEGYGLFCSGILGMARSGDPSSGNSQFFLMRQANQSLNRSYTPVGRVVVGEDVVRSIKTGEPVAAPRDVMTKVYVLGDLPEAQRPKVRVIDTRSNYFHALAVRTRDAAGDRFTLCDVEVAGEVQ